MWNYISSDHKTISLHDMIVDDLIQNEDNITLVFNDGFAVRKENNFNTTHKHMHTNKSCMILHDAIFNYAIDLDLKTPITLKTLFKQKSIILKDTYENNHVTLLYLNEKSNFCEVNISYSKIQFCWNDYQCVAWFEGWKTNSQK